MTTIDGQPIPDRQAVIRSDSRTVLGVVGKSYQPVQNRQCFGFLDSVVVDGRLRYHTAGALGQGERVWMLAKLPDEIRVKNSDDVTEQFLLLSNSHDGSSSLRVLLHARFASSVPTPSGWPNGDRDGSGVSIVHKGDLAAKVREAQEILGLAKNFYDDLGERINRLASHQPSRRQLETYYESLYPDRANGQNNRAANIRSKLVRPLRERNRPGHAGNPKHDLGGLQRRDRVRRSSPIHTWSDRLRPAKPPTRIRLVRLRFSAQVEGLDTRPRNGGVSRLLFNGRFSPFTENV